MENRIEKSAELAAPVARVWQALSDYKEFGSWFGVKLNQPFAVGQAVRGHITHPGYEHLKWEAVIQTMEPQKLFSFTWHPYAIDPKKDYSGETPTHVEFKLEPSGQGTLLRIIETGFEKIPEGRREEAYRMHETGWTQQLKNIAAHLEKTPQAKTS